MRTPSEKELRERIKAVDEHLGPMAVYGGDFFVMDVKLVLERLDRAREVLKEITEGKGPFSMDPYTHACNTVEAMKELASSGLAELEDTR